MGGKEDKYDEMGQLPGGYDVFLARETAFKHAQEQLSNEKRWLQDLLLEWEIRSARFDEDEDCYKVVLECYPDDADVETKSQWEYHIDATGKLYPGTPRLVSQGTWIVKRQRRNELIKVVRKTVEYCLITLRNISQRGLEKLRAIRKNQEIRKEEKRRKIEEKQHRKELVKMARIKVEYYLITLRDIGQRGLEKLRVIWKTKRYGKMKSSE